MRGEGRNEGIAEARCAAVKGAAEVFRRNGEWRSKRNVKPEVPLKRKCDGSRGPVVSTKVEIVRRGRADENAVASRAEAREVMLWDEGVERAATGWPGEDARARLALQKHVIGEKITTPGI